MSAEQVAQEFIQFYYGTREGNPQGIGALYVSTTSSFDSFLILSFLQQDQSVLTFEGQRYEGPNQITEKLVVRSLTKVIPNSLHVRGLAKLSTRKNPLQSISSWVLIPMPS